MDFFHTPYLGTPGKQALEALLGLKPTKSMFEAAAEKQSKMRGARTPVDELPSRNWQTISSATYGLLNVDERLKGEFFEECRPLEGRATR